MTEDRNDIRHLELFSEAEAIIDKAIELVENQKDLLEVMDPTVCGVSTEFLAWAEEHKRSIEKSYTSA